VCVATCNFSDADAVHLHELQLNFGSFVCQKIIFVLGLHYFEFVFDLLLDPKAFACMLDEVTEKAHFLNVILAKLVEFLFRLLDLLCFVFKVKLDKVRLNFRALTAVS
jgi:hypothetical protein